MEKGSLNHVRLIGNIGQQPEVRYSKAGFAYATFSIATTESVQVKNQPNTYEDVTTWHKCLVSGKKAELMGKNVRGAKVHVEGKIALSKYTDKQGIERDSFTIKVKTITILQWPKNDGGQQGGGNQQGGGYQQNSGGTQGRGYQQNSGGQQGGGNQQGSGNPFGGEDEPLPF